MVAIPLSRELLERGCKIDEKPLFGTTRILKCKVPALVRLTRKCFLAHRASEPIGSPVAQNDAAIFPETLKNSGKCHRSAKAYRTFTVIGRLLATLAHVR